MHRQSLGSGLFKKAAEDAHLGTRITFKYQNRGPEPLSRDFFEIGPTDLTRIEAEGTIEKRKLRLMMNNFEKVLRAQDHPKWPRPHRWITVALEISAESPDDRIARIEQYRITAPRGGTIELYITRHLLALVSKYDACGELFIRGDGPTDFGNVHHDAENTFWPKPLSLKKDDLDLPPQALTKTWADTLDCIKNLPDWHESRGE